MGPSKASETVLLIHNISWRCWINRPLWPGVSICAKSTLPFKCCCIGRRRRYRQEAFTLPAACSFLPSSRLGPDCNQLKACRNWGQTNQSRQSSVSLGFFLTYFRLLQLSFFPFASTITDICSLGAFQLFFFFHEISSRC